MSGCVAGRHFCLTKSAPDAMTLRSTVLVTFDCAIIVSRMVRMGMGREGGDEYMIAPENSRIILATDPHASMSLKGIDATLAP